jgi:hypothetical protein
LERTSTLLPLAPFIMFAPHNLVLPKKTLFHYNMTFINSPLIHNYIYLNIFIFYHNSFIGMHEGKGILKTKQKLGESNNKANNVHDT